jgi:hypothetical protein
MKMEQCSATSAYKIQTPGNYPEENIQHEKKKEEERKKERKGMLTTGPRCVVELCTKIVVLNNVKTRNNRQCVTVSEMLIWDLSLLCAVQLQTCEFCTYRQWHAYKGLRNLLSIKCDIQDINMMGVFQALTQFMNRTP